MSEKEFKYRVSVDTADVARAAAETRRAFSQEMNRVPIGGAVGSPAGSSPASGLLGDLGKLRSLLAGGIAGYGLAQIDQMGRQLAQLGAVNERTAESFKGLAANVNVASDSLIDKLGRAVQGTVTDNRMMAHTNILLVTAQSQQIEVTERQIEVLAKFARLRATQLGLPTEDAYARLVLGISKRESELLDELGLSTKGIAASIGVPVEQINRSTESLLKGIVSLAEQELSVTPEPLLDDAAEIEVASKKIQDSWDRLAEIAKNQIVLSVGWRADLAEVGVNILEHIFGSPEMAQEQLLLQKNVEKQLQVQDILGDRYQQRKADMPVLIPGLPYSSDTKQQIEDVGRLKDAADALNRATQGGVGHFTRAGDRQQANEFLGVMEKIGNVYAQIDDLGEVGTFDQAALLQVEEQWFAIVNSIGDGNFQIDDANAKLSQMLGLLSQIAPMVGPAVAAPANTINPWGQGVLDRWAARSRFNQVVAGNVAPTELSDDEKKYRLAVGDTAEKLAIYQSELDGLTGASQDLTGVSQEAYEVMAKIAGLKGQLDADDERKTQETRDRFSGLLNAQLGLRMAQNPDPASQIALLQSYGDILVKGSEADLNNQERIAGLQQRMIEDARQEWRRTAQEVERNFEAAADKILGIPGVTSLTPVTSQQMLDTRYGVYEEQPDEWVRRVRDELTAFDRQTRTDEYGNTTETLIPRETTDYPDVSREQVEQLTGMPAGTPHDVLIPRLERMWESGSLFADPANLDLLNMDAIRGQYEEMKAGAVGRQNQRQYIMEQLGVSAADAALITGQQAPIVQMLTGGQSVDEIAAQMGGLGTTISQMLAPQVVVTGQPPLLQMLTGGLTAEELAEQMNVDRLGITIAERMLAPLQSGSMITALARGWEVDVRDNYKKLYGPIDSLAGSVNERLDEKIGAGLKIVDIVVARVLEEIADDL